MDGWKAHCSSKPHWRPCLQVGTKHWVYPGVIDIFDNKFKKNRIVQSEFCVVGAHLGAMVAYFKQ